ncbi:MAG: YceI family protein [Planctomycetes bacterium]|nr:YceI family protein [Planctomycetota bacterium]
MKSILLLAPLCATLALTAPTTLTPTPAGFVPGDHDWVVDAVHSSVVFRVKHADISWFQGSFDHVEGTLTFDPAHPEAGKVALTIPVDKLDSNDAKRDGHLAGPDFFNAKENPNIVFSSTKIQQRADGKFDVTGELELAGTKKPITLLVEKSGEGDFYGPRIGWWTTFSIKRSDFGMDYGVAKNQLGDEVMLSIGLETTKAK